MSKASPYTAAQLLLWRRLYGFNGWTTGAEGIVALITAPALFNVTASDAVCQANPVTGFSSGADGEACTPTSLWNDTVWRELGGEVCFTSPGFLINPYYVADPSIEGCIDAFDAYRNATAAEFKDMMLWVYPPKEEVKAEVKRLTEAQRAEIKSIFVLYDANNNGVLDKKELAEALAATGYESDEVEEMFEEYDDDGSGEIDLDEFVRMLEHSYLK